MSVWFSPALIAEPKPYRVLRSSLPFEGLHLLLHPILAGAARALMISGATSGCYPSAPWLGYPQSSLPATRGARGSHSRSGGPRGVRVAESADQREPSHGDMRTRPVDLFFGELTPPFDADCQGLWGRPLCGWLAFSGLSSSLQCKDPRTRPTCTGRIEIIERAGRPGCSSETWPGPHGPQSTRTGESARLAVIGGWPPVTSITSMRCLKSLRHRKTASHRPLGLHTSPVMYG